MSTIEMSNTFHIAGLDKQGAIAIARQLGLRRDWARVKLAEICKLLSAFNAQQLLDAAKLTGYFTNTDLELLTDPEQEFEDEGDDDEATADSATPESAELPRWPHAEIKPEAKPEPKVEAKAPEAAPATTVSKVAELLAQLLATGKAGLDASEVGQIVQPMINDAGSNLLIAAEHKIEDAYQRMVKVVGEAIKNVPAREILVKSERGEVKIEGLQHREFETLLHLCAARQPDSHRLNVWLYGPPGTGKTTAAMNAAKALGLPFYCNSALSTKYELIGFKDASGTYQSTPFRQAWEQGGVYLFDEIDGSDPKAVVAFNSALANGIMAFPDGMVERHADAVMIAASNTVYGATSEFTGRMKLDAATIDRFVFLEWEIDEAMERAMCPSASWVKYVQQFRAKIKAKGVKVQITPRATLYGASLLAQGMNEETVKRVVLRKGMTAEQWAILEA